MVTRFLSICCLLIPAFLFSDCKPEEEVAPYATILLRLTHKAGNQALEFNQNKYTNALSQSYSVSKLNYFISNVKMRNAETGAFYFEVNSYHLVKATKNPSNTEIVLQSVPMKKFTELEFSIGVDNSANHSTDNIGDLDPANGMAWDWTMGYKFMELEGNFTTATKSGSYVFHMGEDVTYKTLKFNFKDVTGSVYDITKSGEILLDVDVNACFGNPNPVDFDTFYRTESAASGGTKIAENYASGMFRLTGAQ